MLVFPPLLHLLWVSGPDVAVEPPTDGDAVGLDDVYFFAANAAEGEVVVGGDEVCALGVDPLFAVVAHDPLFAVICFLEVDLFAVDAVIFLGVLIEAALAKVFFTVLMLLVGFGELVEGTDFIAADVGVVIEILFAYF